MTAGARWEQVGPWAMAPNFTDVQSSSHTLTSGAVHVKFDLANNPANDEVWVGTGEPGRGGRTPFDMGTVGQYGGVGVLHSVGPVQRTRTSPLLDPWDRHAQFRNAANPNPYAGLRGAGVFSLAADPADATKVVAATTRGVHHNISALAPDPWVQATIAAWEAVSAGASAREVVTDVAWTPATGAHPSRLWLAVVDTVTPALTGVWVSANGVAGPFVQIALAGILVGGANTVIRLALGTDPAHPDVVYVFGSGPQMWRIDGLVPATVAPLPATIFMAPADQSDWDIAIAVDPRNANRVIIAGGGGVSPHDNSFSAAIYRITIGGAAPAYNTDYVAGDTNDARWNGAGVHADVHRVRWRAVGADDHVWVGCDGGIFRSAAAGNPRSFTSRATGLAVTEPGFVASHPVTDGLVIIGVQDNGVQLRIGESVWRLVQGGDGGGVTFDPGTTGRFAAHMTQSDWNDDGGQGISPARRSTAFLTPAAGDSPALAIEDGASRFYSNAAAITRGDGVTQLVVGTNRVWYTERWGRTRWDGVAGVWRRFWTTLPGNADPRAGNANDAVTDVLAPGPQPRSALDNSTVGIRSVRWAGPDRLYVVLPGAIYRLDRNPPTVGAWATTAIVTRPAPPAIPPLLPWPVAGANLPDIGAMNDLAPHNPAAGPHGSFYVAMSHPLEPIWWFDGTGVWHPARLGTINPPAPPLPALIPMPPTGVRAPAYSIVVDPDDPRIVYVGTTVGVWRGELALIALTPTWTWRPYASGLPEAAVQDLEITRWPRPAGGNLKLLRAAVQSRGVWEVEPGVDTPAATYLRVHPYDTRRITPTDQRDPMWNRAAPERDWPLDWADRRNRDYRNGAGQPRATPDGTAVGSFHWHGSPDIRVRPAQGGGAVPVGPGLPWANLPTDRFWLWSVQTALRTIDPLIVADGRWTAGFRARLQAARVTLGIDAAPGQQRVTATLWNNAQVQAGFWADPWEAGGPTEADLIERVYGQTTPRVGGPASAATSPASLAVMRRPYKIDVCLHHRGRLPLAASGALVILLRFQLPAAAATWAALPTIALPADPALTALRAALTALPVGGGALPPALALPGGWGAADVGVAIRRPDRDIATGAPAIVTFDVNFSAAAAGTRWMLVALAHSAVDPLALTGATLSAVILGSRHAAARSVQVV